MNQRNASFRGNALTLLSLLVFFASACGDVTSGTGEFGRVNYSLHTKYFSDDSQLTRAKLLVGYPQEIQTRLTSKGAEDVEDPTTLTHEFTPKEDVSALLTLDDGYDVPDLSVTVTQPGQYSLETRNENLLFDRIQLEFAVPETLEVITWVRRSSDSEFSKVTAQGTILVDEGTQVTVIPVPVAVDGQRIVGDFNAVITPSPAGLVVFPENILGAYEQSIWSTPDPISMVFIDPGTVEVTIEDAVNKVSTVLTFQITDAN